jgi:hypothetical protein
MSKLSRSELIGIAIFIILAIITSLHLSRSSKKTESFGLEILTIERAYSTEESYIVSMQIADEKPKFYTVKPGTRTGIFLKEEGGELLRPGKDYYLPVWVNSSGIRRTAGAKIRVYPLMSQVATEKIDDKGLEQYSIIPTP